MTALLDYTHTLPLAKHTRRSIYRPSPLAWYPFLRAVQEGASEHCRRDKSRTGSRDITKLAQAKVTDPHIATVVD